MKQDAWNPEQYGKFREERAKPFWDLVALGRPEKINSILDLGCGTGELTAELSRHYTNVKHTHGIDNSKAMLEKAKENASKTVTFELAEIETFKPRHPYDLIFSNAALHWIPNHIKFLKKIFKWVSPQGQFAVQMPYNFDHVSHTLALETAKGFPELAEIESPNVQHPDFYHALLKEHFAEHRLFVEVYHHPMDSGASVAEWTKGTYLTIFQRRLEPDQFERFFTEYKARLLSEIGRGPCVYTFKRILMWAQNAPPA